MNTKENHYHEEKLLIDTTEAENRAKLRSCDPDKYLRHSTLYRASIIDYLESARSLPRPPLNKDFIRLIKLWRLIASKYTSGDIPGNDLEFLRWLLEDRARQAVVFLRRQSDISVWYALKAIERIVNFNISTSNAIEHQIAMADWVWLKHELTGDLRIGSLVDIRKIRLKPMKRPRA